MLSSINDALILSAHLGGFRFSDGYEVANPTEEDPTIAGYLHRDGSWFIMKSYIEDGIERARFAAGQNEYEAAFSGVDQLTFGLWSDVF